MVNEPGVLAKVENNQVHETVWGHQTITRERSAPLLMTTVNSYDLRSSPVPSEGATKKECMFQGITPIQGSREKCSILAINREDRNPEASATLQA